MTNGIHGIDRMKGEYQNECVLVRVFMWCVKVRKKPLTIICIILLFSRRYKKKKHFREQKRIGVTITMGVLGFLRTSTRVGWELPCDMCVKCFLVNQELYEWQ